MLRNEICARLDYLCQVGLSYLTLDRSTRTLSGGEVQRVNLTTCLGASLVNTLFVMDEPSVGLHPRDIGQLVRVMHNLRDKGNTLLVVEHEEQIIRASDNLIDLGPGRGERGGELVFAGPLAEFLGGPLSSRSRRAFDRRTDRSRGRGAAHGDEQAQHAIISAPGNRFQCPNRAGNSRPRSRLTARVKIISRTSMSKFHSMFSRA
jgi:energy-coupling factor transporter ATP-binding protein EcfA2